MAYWAYGTNMDGNPEMLGPFDMAEAASLEGDIAELRQPRIINAPDRETAMRQIQQQPGRFQPNLLSTDGPAQPFDPSRFPQLQRDEEN